MRNKLTRRGFVKTSLIASATLPFAWRADGQAASAPAAAPAPAPASTLPMGLIAGQQFTRLMIGGNLIGGWTHSRELTYVSTLARRYNTDAKIRETLELAESHGVNSINT